MCIGRCQKKSDMEFVISLWKGRKHFGKRTKLLFTSISSSSQNAYMDKMILLCLIVCYIMILSLSYKILVVYHFTNRFPVFKWPCLGFCQWKLTLYNIIPTINDPKEEGFGKPCGKRKTLW